MGHNQLATSKGGHKDWVNGAIDILKPVTDGGDITNEYQDVERESMRDLMEHIRELQEYLKEGFPDDYICECEDDKCPAWEMGYDKGVTDIAQICEPTAKVED